MTTRNQRGALSLFWCTVAMLIVAAGAATALMSMREERNFFAEAWEKISRKTGPIAPVLEQPGKAARAAGSGENVSIRKCIINGSVTYSNVECDAQDPTTKKVEVHVPGGIEAPKAVPTSAAIGKDKQSSDLQQIAIDKATHK